MADRRCGRLSMAGVFALGLTGVFFQSLSSPADAHHLGSSQNLKCDAAFPCHEEITGRVQFWVDVFSKWSNDQIILHDKNRPERVYAVIKTKASCTDRNSKRRVDKYRKGVAADLKDLAKRIDRGNTAFSDEDQHYLKLFPSRSAKRIRKSAETIRCQQGNKTRFAAALARFEQYRPMVERQLADSGVADDIKYLPFVESAYNPEAYSRVGAAGLWQIMPRTARSLGLSLNATIDERLDPFAATRAAGVYLSRARKSLAAEAAKKGQTISDATMNPFVITSYNYGVSGMRRAIRTHGLDFVEVLNKYKSRSFRTAVRNFYASFLAARHVAKNADRYFDNIESLPRFQHKLVRLEHATSLERVEKVFGLSADTLKPLNPALTRFIWHRWRFIPAGYHLRLPAQSGDWSAEIAQLESLKPQQESSAGSTYRVKRGDTACGVAHAFRVSCRDLVDANQLGRKAVIRVGQKLTIPGKGRRSSSTQVAQSSNSAKPTAASYKVNRGDTPCGISRKLGVSCQQLMKANRISRRGLIQPGQILKVPGAGATAAKTAKSNLPATVRVRRGDTACGIATQLGISCKSLMATNKLSKQGLIRVGQTLKVPGAGSVSAKSESTEDVVTTVTVKKGDTACAIARRAGVNCNAFMKLNGLNSKTLIQPGQRLKIKAGAVLSADAGEATNAGVETAAPVQTVTVRSGDTPCGIARRHGLECGWFMSINGLRKGGIIRPGQQLQLVDVTVEQGEDGGDGVAANSPVPVEKPSVLDGTETSGGGVSKQPSLASSDAAQSSAMLTLDEPVDLRVRASDSGDSRYSIRVEPEETLGHYADWLDTGYAGSIRRLNGLNRSASVFVGQRIALPVTSQSQLEAFEARRMDYHRVLIEQFKERFTIDKVDQYSVKAGDSSWSIAAKGDMPLWLLTRFNKSLRDTAPKPGQTLQMPVLRAQ